MVALEPPTPAVISETEVLSNPCVRNSRKAVSRMACRLLSLFFTYASPPTSWSESPITYYTVQFKQIGVPGQGIRELSGTVQPKGTDRKRREQAREAPGRHAAAG